jgi:hypothetical protein
VLLGQGPNDYALMTPEGSTNDDFVAALDLAMGLGRLAVDLNSSVAARLLGLRPGPKQTGDVQPLVETHPWVVA